MSQTFYAILRNDDGECTVFPKIEVSLKAAVETLLEDLNDELCGLFDEDEVAQRLKEAERELLNNEDHFYLERLGDTDIIYQIFEVGFKENEGPDDPELPYDEWLDMVISSQNFELKPVNGLYPGEFAHGFYEGTGENDREGYFVLKEMGLPITPLPFDVEQLLLNGTASFQDRGGNTASISYKFDTETNEVVCTANYRGKEESEYVDADDEDMASKKQQAIYRSISIGFGCALALFATLPK